MIGLTRGVLCRAPATCTPPRAVVRAQVTELPAEVVVPECAWAVERDTVVVYLRKWARTGWHKLALAR